MNDVYQDDYKRDYQEYMDEAAECIGRDHSQQPENQQNYEDCPEHFYPFPAVRAAVFTTGNLKALLRFLTTYAEIEHRVLMGSRENRSTPVKLGT